jgi:hypothetical protein
MTHSPLHRAAGAAVLFTSLLLATALPAHAQGVKVALLPATQTVAPGTEFTLSIEVTRAGSPFNAFDCIIGYDPAALTLVQQTPLSLQEGAYFAAGCSNRFHRFQPGADRDTISDVLLCSATSLTGPGQIYKLRFRASNTAQATVVRFLTGLQFYNAGLFVNPDSSSDAAIGIGVPLDVAPERVKAPSLKVTAQPNPARGHVAFRIEAGQEGEQKLLVLDLQGRIVRRLDDGRYPAGSRVVNWDGVSDSGTVSPPGRYIATVRVPGQVREARFTLVR